MNWLNSLTLRITQPSWCQRVAAEFTNVQDWAKHNSMVVNLSKTNHFYNPWAIPILIPPSIFHTEQVTPVKLFDVYIQENLGCDIHFKYIITVSSRRLHILKAAQGLNLELSHCVFHAIIVYKIMYAILAWYGFLNKSYILQINSLFIRAFKYGYVKSVICLKKLLQDYDGKLFHKATYANHAMHHLLTSLKSSGYNLRTLCHGLCVNFIKSQLHTKTFINRGIFNDCYRSYVLFYCIVYFLYRYWLSLQSLLCCRVTRLSLLCYI